MCRSLSDGNGSFNTVYKSLMHTQLTFCSGIPDQVVFVRFGLKEVKMEVYELVDEGW